MALAEMCVGGRLGARLEVDKADIHAPAFLFGETNGCLVLEIRVGKAGAFLGLLDGLPVLRIGVTADSGLLELEAEGVAASVRIDDMVAAFRAGCA